MKRPKSILGITVFFLLYGCSPKEEEAPQKGEPQVIVVVERDIEVNGKTVTMFNILQPKATFGLWVKKGEEFNYPVYNASSFPTSIHWHGLILPNDQDGTACITQEPIPSGATYPYNFKLQQAGTFWMHSHFGLQGQQLLSAPLILIDPEEAHANYQEVVMFLADFTFEYPQTILDNLRRNSGKAGSKMTGTTQDINDVSYDAYLTNSRTLSDPAIIAAQSGKQVRLRIIDGGASTNFFIDLGQLKGQAIAVDGNPIHPFTDSQFQIAAAQRIDLLIDLPQGEGSYPILAQGEGTNMQTGLILTTVQKAAPQSISQIANKTAGAMQYTQEKRLSAMNGLSQKPVDRSLTVNLGGGMTNYIWTINGQAWPDATPLMVKEGERVEIVFNNQTMMSHPMHLHGHTFQVTEINGQPLSGAMRDTILVLPNSTVKVQFDADNPGIWPLHCHNLYHQVAGMMTTVLYEEYKGPRFSFKPCEQCGCLNNK